MRKRRTPSWCGSLVICPSCLDKYNPRISQNTDYRVREGVDIVYYVTVGLEPIPLFGQTDGHDRVNHWSEYVHKGCQVISKGMSLLTSINHLSTQHQLLHVSFAHFTDFHCLHYSFKYNEVFKTDYVTSKNLSFR